VRTASHTYSISGLLLQAEFSVRSVSRSVCPLVTAVNSGQKRLTRYTYMPFGTVGMSSMSPTNHILDGVHIGATWQMRLKDRARVGLSPKVVTQPLPNFLFRLNLLILIT